MNKDLSLAADSYHFAAFRKDADAQANYGFCLEHGLGVERDPSESVEFYKRSTHHRNPTGASQYALSLHFSCGCGDDPEAAMSHYEFVVETRPSLLTGNAARCLRGLNKLSWAQAGIGQGRDHSLQATIPVFGMEDTIARLEGEPIGSISNRRLGKGSYGTVTDENDPMIHGKRIEVKHFESTNPATFMRELGNLINLTHPCVVQLFGWSRSGPRSFEIHMQMAANGAVSDHLRDKKLADPTRQARIICDIVLGMRYIHSCGIIHRDLKPANIMLDENWRALIGDFGFSRVGPAEGLTSPWTGTEFYAAPEQWEAKCPYDGKVDVFAFGWVVYEMMRGPSLVASPDRAFLQNPPVAFGSLIPALVLRCFSINPSDRPSFQEIFDEFQANAWAILPNADVKVVETAVSEVIALERRLIGGGAER
jgi:hypothetical protein